MKYCKHLIASVLFVLILNSLCLAETATVVEEGSANNVVSNYLDAVTAGDIALLRTFLSPSLLSQRETLLANPAYAQQLRAAYSNATYEITDSRLLGTGKVQVEVKIILSENSTMHSRFLLGKTGNQYLIEKEY